MNGNKVNYHELKGNAYKAAEVFLLSHKTIKCTFKFIYLHLYYQKEKSKQKKNNDMPEGRPLIQNTGVEGIWGGKEGGFG